ncbi:PREDICTED: putative pterin-4-alpha-carbinolamine dehydratase [Theobroma cacao]|uniref:4a-hydroxytetrahydrobiopterin dehydratase n=1 Tax=Theobroma cacao TaxID=3641 RepID=A0AB32UZZ9_THECC|nr:PREDICTED: putative pterin-4-alpha-carbinolamine dehydratase [Theobroma cacao]
MIIRMLRTPLFSFSKPQVPLASYQVLFGPHGRSGTQVTGTLRDSTGISSNRIPVYGFRTFCIGTDKDLLTKKCVPCNSKDLRPMTEESANELISKVDGWSLVNEGCTLKLKRSWKVKSFTKGLELFQLIADIAEAEGHHPDLHLVGWNNVTVDIWTHAVGGLTENDFILAAKINGLDLHHLLRKKVTAG